MKGRLLTKTKILILISFLFFVSLDAQTEKEEIKIQEILVTVTRSERKLKDVPITTSVISSKTIEKSQIVNFKYFLEQEIAGVSFGSHGGFANINMLGLGAKYILFLIDGERIAGETFDNVDYNRINLNNVERIEIVKGAASSLYGSNAIGGVINIITKKPKKNVETSISARYGSFNERNANVFIGTKQKWGTLSLSSSYKGQDSYKQKDRSQMVLEYENGSIAMSPLAETPIAGYSDYSVNPKASIYITPKINLDLSTSWYFKERNAGNESAQKQRDEYHDFSNAGKLNIQFSNEKKLIFSGGYGIYERFDKFLLQNRKDRKYENAIWRVSAVYDQKIFQKHSLILGAEWFSEKMLSFLFFKDSSFAKEKAQTYSLFAQQEWNWFKNLTLVLGTRYDHHSEYNGQLTWRFSGMYKWGENMRLRGGYAGGFRSPDLKELYTNWFHPVRGARGFQIVGNSDLKVEKSHNFNLSSDIDFEKLNISVIGQYSRIKDKITTIWKAKSRDTLRYVNLDEAKILSAEVLATYRWKNDVLLRGGYAFTRDFNKEQQLARPHTFTARVEYTPHFVGRYVPMISFSGKYFSGMDIYNIARMKYKVHYEAYSIWRLGVNFKLPISLQVDIGIDNVFDYQPEFSGAYSSISPGRTYFVGLRWGL